MKEEKIAMVERKGKKELRKQAAEEKCAVFKTGVSDLNIDPGSELMEDLEQHAEDEGEEGQ